jgi:copper chaperone NosL
VTRAGLVAAALALSACSPGMPEPVAIVLGQDVCAQCRMVISSRATAAQIVSPGEEPRLFDDLGCLRSDTTRALPPPGSVIVVADHVTGEWVKVDEAVLTEVPGLQTPMGSGLVAHRSAAARDNDRAVSGGRAYPVSALLGKGRP